MWRTTVVLSALLWGVKVTAEGAWWDSAIYYRILVDSFQDSDGDGLGDLGGVMKQIGYVRAIDADAVILSPISARSSDCSQPGVMDFAEIDQRYGNMNSFNSLLEKAKKLELKVVITLPIQAVSTASQLFKSSAEGVSGFEDVVLWKEGSVDAPPPPHSDISWTYHEARKAYYASFNNEVLVNLCSEATAAALSAAQCAWLRRGVAGVLVNPDFRPDLTCGEKMVKKLVVDSLSCSKSSGLDAPAFIVETSLDFQEAANYYGDGVGAKNVISQALTSPSRSSTAELGMRIYGDILMAPQDAVPVWATSAINGNSSRIATRYGSDMVDTINLLSMILPGSTIIQQGDELGTADTILEWATSTTCWPNVATPSSAPLPWDDTTYAGFTTGDPWVPLAPNYRYANAKTEYANEMSHLGVLRTAAAMRKTPAMGPHFEIRRLNGALAVLRWGGTGSLLVVANVARETTDVQLSRIPGVSPEMTVAVSSSGSSVSTGSHIAIDKILKLSPSETILFVGGARHCGGPGPVDKITNKLAEGWQKINKYFSNI